MQGGGRKGGKEKGCTRKIQKKVGRKVERKEKERNLFGHYSNTSSGNVTKKIAVPLAVRNLHTPQITSDLEQCNLLTFLVIDKGNINHILLASIFSPTEYVLDNSIYDMRKCFHGSHS